MASKYVKQTGRKIDYAMTSDWNIQVVAPIAMGKLRTYSFKVANHDLLDAAKALHVQYPRAKVHARSGDVCWTWQPARA
jgi:hypothetical protein